MDTNTTQTFTEPTQDDVDSAIKAMDEQLSKDREYGANIERIDAEHARLLGKPVVRHALNLK